MVNVLIPDSLHYTGYYGGLDFPQASIPEVRVLLGRIISGDPEAEKAMSSLLAKYKLTVDDLATSAFHRTITSQLHADRMIAAALQRRNAAWVELERSRRARSSADSTRNVPPVDASDSPTVPADVDVSQPAVPPGRP
jgi:tRNA isopentenyl-2-thiomethyl-A-37 hydroxylase MiaE